ncbi:MAG: hypothetical protein V9G14_05645 [Cypionkella sp.]
MLGRRKSESTINTRLPVLREHHRQVEQGRGLALAGATADDGDGVEGLVLPGEEHVRPQDSIGLRMRAVRSFLQQGTDVLRNDTQHRRLQRALDIVDRLHRRVQVLDEEGQTHTHHQPHHDAERNVQRDVGFDRLQAFLGDVGDLHQRSAAEFCCRNVSWASLRLENVEHDASRFSTERFFSKNTRYSLTALQVLLLGAVDLRVQLGQLIPGRRHLQSRANRMMPSSRFSNIARRNVRSADLAVFTSG